MLDTTRAEKEFDFKIKMPFEKGLKRKIDWYRKRQGRIVKETYSGVRNP